MNNRQRNLQMLLVCLLTLPFLSVDLQAQETEPVHAWSLDRCVEIALQRSPEVADAGLAIEAADASRKSTRGGFLPRVDMEGNVIVWNEEFKFSFVESSGGALALPAPDPTNPYEIAFYGMLQSLGAPMKARDQVTWGTTFTVSQPLTPLYAIFQAYKLKELGVDVARIQREMRGRDVAFSVAERFIQVLTAERALQMVDASNEQLQRLREQAQSFLNAELIGRNEVLRIDVALAQLAGQRLRMESALLIAKKSLAILMGLKEEAALEIRAPARKALSPGYGSLEEETRRALASRPELKEVDLRIQQAMRGKKLAQFSLVPNLALAGSWQHTEGSKLAEEDSLFVGVFLEWNLFSWGSDRYTIDEADAGLRRARLGRERIKDYIELEVTAAYREYESSLQGIDVAETGLVQALESYRIEQKLFEAHTVSAADLLETHAQLVQAESRQDIAWFELLLSCARLNKATGRPITQGLETADSEVVP